MDILIAIGHIGGAIIAVSALTLVVVLIGTWEVERNQRRLLEEAAMVLGIALEDLENEAHTPKGIQFLAARYSSELLRNRLSDLCGALRTIWSWLGSFLQIVILVGVGWYTFTDNLETAVHAWWIVAVALFFWVFSIAFSLVCRFLTGRYPGEAKQA